MMILKIKFQQLFALLVTLMLAVSCMDDLGNYDYQDINEVAFGNIDEKYVVKRFDNLVINPEVYFRLDESGMGEYEYRWVAVKDTGIGIQELTELSESKNLDEVISLVPGDYFGYYFVKDVKTGIETQYRFDIEVTNSIYEGWLVLSDGTDAPQLDMISLIDGEYSPIYNVLDGSGIELGGEAGFVYTFGYDINFYGIYVSTSGNGTTKIHPDTFEWLPTYTIANEFVTPQPADLELDNLESQSGRTGFALFGGNAYYYNTVIGTAYSSPINILGGTQFEVSPMIGKGGQTTYSAMYDNTNKRFVRSYRGRMYTFAASASTKFDYNNTGMELVYMKSNDYGGYNGAAVFSILRDPATSKYYLAVFNMSNSAQLYYGEITDPNFAQASNITVNPVYGYLYYNIGSKVYRYDWNPEIPATRLELDAGNDEITMLKFHDFIGGKAEYVTMQNHLIVGRHNGTEGKLEFYDVLNLNQPLNLVDTYSGFGKVKSISYRQR
ncbi:PKD-like family lipoprotein [Aestuariibaculum lutulentum]|uniref:PKD-like family lipoprotein n=1 Tax=Aestuariibaculum lutulentum TaxID=2920935 RepID=A0ABS9RLP8_9FLAO|nr:PKD-like family lipoprotein [Aestuariibaculum lutulentum]MCH4553054.1 PKD-like family lipoprotein [Aestuariibaculum lutulentum]